MTALAHSTSLVASGLTRRYGNGRRAKTAVEDVNLDIAQGTRLGIVGESGSGKSTLGLMLVGLEKASSGSIAFEGQDLARLLKTHAGRKDYRRRVQMIGQDTSSSFDPLRTLRDSVRTPAKQLVGLDDLAADARADEVFGLLGLDPALADRYPNEVSGGQRQRFAIARALVVRPTFLVCDEVVSALDVSVQGQVLNSLKKYCLDTGAGLAFISHGLPATAFISEEIIVMYRGRIVEQGPTTRVIHSPEHPYTQHLLNAYHGPNVHKHRAVMVAAGAPDEVEIEGDPSGKLWAS